MLEDILIYARDVAYIIAAAFFVLGIKWLSSPSTAQRGNRLAAFGMLIAVVVTLLSLNVLEWWVIVVGILVGSAIGSILARYVKFLAMPQLVAVFNGFGGGASGLVAAAQTLKSFQSDFSLGAVAIVSIMLSTVIGTVTLTGSFVAFGKLQGILPAQATLFPLRNVVNTALFAVIIGLSILTAFFVITNDTNIVNSTTLWLFLAVVIATLILGITLILPIGGADMPVVVALLNSYSGIAASAAGFAIGNNILIVAGALVGASGLILTRIMTRAMNRSLSNVMLGGFGATTSVQGSTSQKGALRSVNAEDAALILGYARYVIFTPGYGLAVAQAQHAVKELADLLKHRGAQVRYAIHPVAGRMPGHMNVLLAEANIPYEELKDLDQVNNEFESTDVTVVIGANDVINPAARNDTSSPIYGMPILNVDKSKFVIVMKRSMATGFSGVENQLFYTENTAMLFGDAKTSLEAISKEIKEL